MNYYDPTADWSLIPEHMHDGVRRYVMDGHRVGSFLTTLMEGASLCEVAGRADEHNLNALRGWATFLYNHVPSTAHGSRERVEAWQAKGGVNGREEGQ